MTLCINFNIFPTASVMDNRYSLRLNEVRKNLAATFEQSPLMRSYGYAPADDSPKLFARFSLLFVPFIK